MNTLKEAHQLISTMTPMPEVRFVDKMETGQFARQGDLYLVKIEAVPQGLKKTSNRQLAPGATQGSRHTVGFGATIY